MGSAGAMIAAFAFGGFVATAMVDIGHGRPLGVVAPQRSPSGRSCSMMS